MPRPKRPKLVHTVTTGIRPAKTVVTAVEPETDSLSFKAGTTATDASDDSDGLVRRTRRTAGRGRASRRVYEMSGALGAGLEVEADLNTANAEESDVQQFDKIYPGMSQLSTQPNGTNKEFGFSHERPSMLQNARPSRPSTAHQNNRPPHDLRITSTPSAQASMLGRLQFKKRARQPSLLKISHTDQETDDLSPGEDLDDFLPDDESTPLVKSLGQIKARFDAAPRPSRASERKAKESDIVIASSHLTSRQEEPSDVEGNFINYDEASGEEVTTEPTLPLYKRQKTTQPDILSDTMAPPESSSPSPESQAEMNPDETAPTRINSTNRQGKTRNFKPEVKALSTASLQNLLPRRRRQRNIKARGIYDVQESSDMIVASDRDEDELSGLTSKTRTKKQSKASSKVPNALATTSHSLASNKRTSKTYTRKSLLESASEDDSNDDDDYSIEIGRGTTHPSSTKGTASVTLDTKTKNEMRRMTEKFKEVDEYTLDFEDMTGSSSQMKDAR